MAWVTVKINFFSSSFSNKQFVTCHNFGNEANRNTFYKISHRFSVLMKKKSLCLNNSRWHSNSIFSLEIESGPKKVHKLKFEWIRHNYGCNKFIIHRDMNEYRLLLTLKSKWICFVDVWLQIFATFLWWLWINI